MANIHLIGGEKGGVKLGILERQCVRSCLKCAYETLSHVNP